jgi:hypothetical protein
VSIPDGIEILTPWRVLEDSPENKNRAELLSARLASEVSLEHVLHGLKARAVATRIDRDDVLFEVEGGEMPLAVVHMTWRKETDPRWPRTKMFESWEQWVHDEMLPTHEDYSRTEKRAAD